MRSEVELYNALVELRRRLNDVIETFELVRSGIMGGQALAEVWTDYLLEEGKINMEIYAYAFKKMKGGLGDGGDPV